MSKENSSEKVAVEKSPLEEITSVRNRVLKIDKKRALRIPELEDFEYDIAKEMFCEFSDCENRVDETVPRFFSKKKYDFNYFRFRTKLEKEDEEGSAEGVRESF